MCRRQRVFLSFVTRMGNVRSNVAVTITWGLVLTLPIVWLCGCKTSVSSGPHPVTTRLNGGGENPVWCEYSLEIAYLVHAGNETASFPSGVYCTPASGGNPRLVRQASGLALTPVACDPQTGVVLALAPDNGNSVLYGIDTSNGQASKIKDKVFGAAISASGRYALIVRTSSGAKNIALYDPSSGSLRRITNYTSAIDGVNSRMGIDWTWDGKCVVFRHARMYGRPKHVPGSASPGSPPGVDPKADRIPKVAGTTSPGYVVRPGRQGTASLESVDVTTGELEKLPVHEEVSDFAASPTDDRIAYGNDNGLFVVGADRVPVCIARNYFRQGRKSIAWSTDGKMVAYDAEDGNIWVAPIGSAGK